MIYKFKKSFDDETREVEAKTYQHAMRLLREQFGEDAEEWEFVGYGEGIWRGLDYPFEK